MNEKALPSPLALRFDVRKEDMETIRAVVRRAGVFNPEEIDVAVELIEERLQKGERSGYHFIFAEFEGIVAGYICYGPIPLTRGRFDIYWIAVNPEARGAGIGGRLLKEAGEIMARCGGEMIFAETSSRPEYRPARNLYIRSGYGEIARIKDFYSDGDDKVIFSKRLPPG